MNGHEALQHAVIAHDGEYDRCNLPAILHPIEVASKLTDETLRVLAYLHDVWEDTCYPRCRLAGLTVQQENALECLTRKDGEAYEDYIERVCGNPLSCYVKLADLHTNLHRQPGHSDTKERITEREVKYLLARERIWDAIEDRWWPDA